MNQDIILFGKGFAPPSIADVTALGRKAADLALMAKAKINIPASAVLPVQLIDVFLKKPEQAKVWLDVHLDDFLHRFGVKDLTLLAVRLSPIENVPGIGETILGLGQTEAGFAAHSSRFGEHFAWRKRREMIVSYGEFAKNIGAEVFEEALEDLIGASATERELCEVIENCFLENTGEKFNAGRKEQVTQAIVSGLKSWISPRAAAYRELNGMQPTNGLAIMLQRQVIYDADVSGCAGSIISRSLETGAKKIHGFWHGVKLRVS